jgi:hypothetical protein
MYLLSFFFHNIMVSSSFIKRFRKLDAYAKTLDDFRVRTATGGAGTMGTALSV